MQNMPKHLRPADVACGLDAVLEDGAALAASRTRDNGGGNEVVRVQYNHVLGVVHDTLSPGVEIADQMDVGVFSAW